MTIGAGPIGGQTPPRFEVIEFTGDGPFPWDLAPTPDGGDSLATTQSEISETSAAVSRTTSTDIQLQALDVVEALARNLEDSADDR